MKTLPLNPNQDHNEAASELRILSRDGRWLRSADLPMTPVSGAADVPGDVILQLVSRAKDGPAPLQTVLDAVRRQWNAAA